MNQTWKFESLKVHQSKFEANRSKGSWVMIGYTNRHQNRHYYYTYRMSLVWNFFKRKYHFKQIIFVSKCLQYILFNCCFEFEQKHCSQRCLFYFEIFLSKQAFFLSTSWIKNWTLIMSSQIFFFLFLFYFTALSPNLPSAFTWGFDTFHFWHFGMRIFLSWTDIINYPLY